MSIDRIAQDAAASSRLSPLAMTTVIGKILEAWPPNLTNVLRTYMLHVNNRKQRQRDASDYWENLNEQAQEFISNLEVVFKSKVSVFALTTEQQIKLAHRYPYGYVRTIRNDPARAVHMLIKGTTNNLVSLQALQVADRRLQQYPALRLELRDALVTLQSLRRQHQRKLVE